MQHMLHGLAETAGMVDSPTVLAANSTIAQQQSMQGDGS